MSAWIPQFELRVSSQLYKEFKLAGITRRRLINSDGVVTSNGRRLSDRRRLVHEADRAKIGTLHGEHDHRGLALLRSLCERLDGPTFGETFAACPVDTTAGEVACLQISNATLNMKKIQEFVEPLVEKFVEPTNKSGSLGNVQLKPCVEDLIPFC